MKRTALYRHFDAAGVLLYVGISNNALRRMLQHQGRSHWYEQVATVRLQWFPSRALAEQAETAAIWSEWPLWNLSRPTEEPAPEPLWCTHLRGWDLDTRIPL